MLDRLQAEETLTQFSISAYPHMKKEARQRLHKETHKIANPPAPSKEAIALKDLTKHLAGEMKLNGF